MLNENNRKAELSYAYLHAVAAGAGFACSCTHRHLDGCGVDARIDIREQLRPESQLTEFTLDFQLKATSTKLAAVNDRLSFSIDVGLYDNLRTTTIAIPRFIVLLHMPEDPDEWLCVTGDGLIAKRCARWICLSGAPGVETATTTIRFPLANILTPDALRNIAANVSIGEVPSYDE
jgi:hypothetical protein